MSEPLLILDCNYLCRRAQHTTGGLTHKGNGTGVLFGFFRDLVMLENRFRSSRFAFCFDAQGSKRKEIYPDYKSKRISRYKAMPPAERKQEDDFYRQVRELREDYLPKIGYRNIFHSEGYEADDLIAKIVLETYDGFRIVIVSSDQDLYQLLLDDAIRIYDPRKNEVMTANLFVERYQIVVRDWIQVKAISGCRSDDVPNIGGVGIKTALKYLDGSLSTNSAAYQKIEAAHQIIKRNRLLVTLPFKGTPDCGLRSDEFNRKNWIKVMDSLGLKSIHSMHRRRRAYYDGKEKA